MNHPLFTFSPPIPCRNSSCIGQGLGIFSQLLPKGLEGSVLFLHDVGNAPTSGNALINYGLPQEFQESEPSGTKIAMKNLGGLIM